MERKGPAVEAEQERSPATWGLAAVWIVVFVAMCLDQGTIQAIPGHVLSGGISPVTASRFGDITPQVFLDGQWWRALTCTFIHYSWLHLGFNLIMLYTLGRLMEPWYGWGGFLGVYCVIGFVGSVLAVTIKPYFGHSMIEHSGGGSGVLCGLIALLAVVGWRSKTRFGDYVKGQMVGLLIFIAVMGLVVPNVGNFEHGGGAVVGAVLGFVHRRLIRLTGTRLGRQTGIACLLILATCAGLQARSGSSPDIRDRMASETLERMRARQEAIRSLQILATLYWNLSSGDSERLAEEKASQGSFIDPIQQRFAMQRLRLVLQQPMNQQVLRTMMLKQAEVLSTNRTNWVPEDDQKEWETIEQQIQTAAARRPTPGEIVMFRRAFEAILGDLTTAQSRDGKVFQELQTPARAPKPNGPRPKFGQ